MSNLPYIIASETGRADSRAYALASLSGLVDSILRCGYNPAFPVVVCERSQTQADKDGVDAILAEWKEELTRQDGTVGAYSYGDPRKDPKSDDGKEKRASIPGQTLMERVRTILASADTSVGIAEGRRRMLACAIASAIRGEAVIPATVTVEATEAGVRSVAIGANLAQLLASRATPADVVSVVLNYFNLKGASVGEAALMKPPFRFNKGLAQRTQPVAAVCFALGLTLDSHIPGVGPVRENLGAGLTEAWRTARNESGLTVDSLAAILTRAIEEGRKPAKLDTAALREVLANLPVGKVVDCRELGLAMAAGMGAVRALLGLSEE